MSKQYNLKIHRFPERMMRANSYAIQIGDRYTLIDPSIAPATFDQVLGEGEHEKVTRVVVTHPHYDHIVYLDNWHEPKSLPVYIHELAPDVLKDPELNASTVFGREVRYGLKTNLLREGAKIQLEDGFYLTAIYLPGHTIADLAFTLRHKDEKNPFALFMGDILFADSIGRTDLIGGDSNAQRESLERLARLLMIWPQDIPVYSGHGKVFTIEEAMRQNAFIMASSEAVKRKAGIPLTRSKNLDERSFVWPDRPCLIAYVGTDDLKHVSITDTLDIDIINIAFSVIRNGIAVWQPDAFAVEALSRLRAINPSIRIVLSIGGWGAGGFSEMARTAEGRRLFTDSCTKLVKDYGLDGIDLDWEYPGSSAAGIESSPDDKENFSLLLQDLRDALSALGRRYYQLSIAAGAAPSYIERTEMAKVAEIVDYVQLMTYDLSPAYGQVTGHHTNLYPSKIYQERARESALADRFNMRFGEAGKAMLEEFIASSVDQSVSKFREAGVPREKIVIGAAFYGRSFHGIIGSGDGLAMQTAGDTEAGPVYDTLTEEYLEQNGFERYWDEDAKAPWLFNGDTFITYDDPNSLDEKAKYAVSEGLGGVMYWVYDAGKKQGLNHVLRTALDKAHEEERF